jgi:formylglycine-generating enzyme required for sulfatase activity
MFNRGDPVPDNNRWTLLERLGIGGFGEVWKARNREDDFSVFKFCLDPDSQERMFTHERKIIKLVKTELDDHPNIVKLMDSHLEGATPWLQYEFAPGGDLLHNFATWPKDLSARVTMSVEKIRILAETMSHCHALRPMSVIHRDLKPANIVIGKRGEYKITDFGIGDTTARQALEEARIATASGMTATTTSVRCFNTPMYASPDQKKGLDPHPADDVHALGVMLYQFILGNVGLELGIDMWNDLESFHVCRQLLEVLDKSVATRVERRFQHAGELAEALKSLPKKLISERVTPVEREKEFNDELTRRATEAKAKNEQARQLFDKRQWKEAKALLDGVHPVLRERELYKSVSLYAEGKKLKNSLGMEFAWVPPGDSWLGGGGGTAGTRKFTVEEGFWAGIYPITQAEWQTVTGGTPSHFKGNPRFPVESVSWDLITNTFLVELNKKCKGDGYLYRLPTEDEWEYICRGGPISQAQSAFHYYFAKSKTDLAPNPTNELTQRMACFDQGPSGKPSEVGSFLPNSLGIYDMHGNVWEWTASAEGSSRVNRGGSWRNSAGGCAAAYRDARSPSIAGDFLGFRLLAVPLVK